MSSFTKKTLLITGGTGSFGNAVLHRFLKTDIGEIRVFSRDEKKQDEEAFDHVYSMMDLISRKYTSLLQDTKIGASGKDCLILICIYGGR